MRAANGPAHSWFYLKEEAYFATYFELGGKLPLGTVPGGHGVPEPVPELAWFELPEVELFEFDDEFSGVAELDDEFELFDEF
jgi:hypothetical protein